MRLPHRFHGTARPQIGPELIEKALILAEFDLTPSKFAPFDEFLVEKARKRGNLRRKRAVKVAEEQEVRRSEEFVNDDVIRKVPEVEIDSDEIEVTSEVTLSLLQKPSTSSTSLGICSICAEEIRDGKFPFCLPCAHSFCCDCWLQHVQLSMKEGRQTGCMEPNCPHLLTPDDSTSLLSQESAEIYGQFVENLNEMDKLLSCPDCREAVENTGSRSAVCRCGTVICPSCASHDHRPVSCSVYAEYRKTRDGREFDVDISWYPLLKDVSKCPKCGWYAQKEGGCQSVGCICGFNYCFKCSREYHFDRCHKRAFKVHLIDVTAPAPTAKINPALINRTLAARQLFDQRRSELVQRMKVLGKLEAALVMRSIDELTRLLELAVLSSEWRVQSRRAIDTIHMAFFGFANTSDGTTADLRRKCDKLRQQVVDIRKTL